MYEDLLRETGLSHNEARIYEALLHLGEASVQQISNRSKVHRRNVYDSLQKLMERGLASEVFIKGEKHFKAINPRRLLEYTDMLFDFHYRSFGHRNPIIKSSTYKITYHAAKEILELNGINVSDYEKSKNKDTKSARETDTFEKFFSDQENKLIQYLITDGPATPQEIKKHMKISLQKVRQMISKLQRKKGIRNAGKKNNKTFYEVSPEAKRLSVKE